MGINYYRAVNLGSKLTSMGSKIDRISINTKKISNIVPSAYDGEDAKIFATAIDRLQSEFNSIESELKLLGNKVVSVAGQIRREEEEKERMILEAAKAKLKV